ncbi:DNA glycosylase AlkZ-like family protein [Abyssisolibacter fermentans]|uniref:DNA glycosylase AlkZ-like family protein n=1 Tax=Abyssisolibacter fermentans TaxID=1766203 RepID=UPI000831BDA5|nr:crosslink repair DNA glycosylase YcaQ family protein [Abyssisolibacter fermentans]
MINIKIAEENINNYRFNKLNIYNSVDIRTYDELDKLINCFIGLHAARIGKPYLSLLSKGVTCHVNKLYEYINNSNKYVTIRCVRKTLHITNIRNAEVLHHATSRLRIPPKIKKFNAVKLELFKDFAKNLFIVNTFINPNDLEEKFMKKFNVDKIDAKLINKFLWESGILYLKNLSKQFNKEKRVFGLFQKAFNFDLELSKQSEQEYINELIKYYIYAFGPVSKKDIIWWTGISSGKINKAIESIKKSLTIIYGKNSNIQMLIFNEHLDSLVKIKKMVNECKFLAYEDCALKAYYETRKLYTGNYALYFNKIGEVYATILMNGECIGQWEIDKPNKKIKFTIHKQMCSKNMERIQLEKERMESLIF